MSIGQNHFPKSGYICDQIVKTCIVHTSKFSTLVIHKSIKNVRIIELRTTYSSIDFNSVPFTVVFISLQILKIGCVNYTHFPKSGHV